MRRTFSGKNDAWGGIPTQMDEKTMAERREWCEWNLGWTEESQNYYEYKITVYSCDDISGENCTPEELEDKTFNELNNALLTMKKLVDDTRQDWDKHPTTVGDLTWHEGNDDDIVVCCEWTISRPHERYFDAILRGWKVTVTRKAREGTYSDWFGEGNVRQDAYVVVMQNGIPEKVMFGGDGDYMACIVYPDAVIVTGYDGAEYCHGFGFFEDERSFDRIHGIIR